VPNIARLKEDDPARVLPGYDYDLTNEDVLLSRLSVKDGRLVLPEGQSYRLLALPDHRVLSLAALKKIRELVRAGATVLGPKPERTVSLMGYPGSETELQRMAGELWGEAAGAAGEDRAGRGRVIWGRTAREVLLADRIAPDFEPQAIATLEGDGAAGDPGGVARGNAGSNPARIPPHTPADNSVNTPANTPAGPFDYIHHRLGEADYYFVSNQDRQSKRVDGVFRVSGRQPELWDPLTGRIWEARAFSQRDGRTIVPLEFTPYGSIFVVFRKPISPEKSGEDRSNFPVYRPVSTIEGAWSVRFDPKWGGPESVIFDRLINWTARPEEGIRFYSGRATYRIEFDLDPAAQTGSRLALGLGDVRDVGIARVRLNGRDLGVTWTPPFRIEIGSALKPQGNVLEVDVINSWRNRLVGDRELTEDRRFTRTNITVRREWPLLDSGLLGPVQIFTVTN
jgi:hypothetical protein